MQTNRSHNSLADQPSLQKLDTMPTSALATETELSHVVVRFCGDSGDGMQLTGSQFTHTAAVSGNDLMTFPDFPAEIRAPQGTLAGVSGFQVHFSDHSITTPGDEVDVLVAMNPAALKSNLASLRPRGILIVNKDAFDAKNLKKVHYDTNPLEDEALSRDYQLISAGITSLTHKALEGLGLSKKDMDRSKNFFALGITYWLFERSLEPTLEWIEGKFAKKPEILEANERALKAGYNFAENCELFASRYKVKKASLPPGRYRNITGGSAISLGIVAAGELAKLPVFFAGYPITPASDLLHELSRYKNLGVRTFQAEDEIAAIGAAIGASYGGSLAVTASSGPGIALKMEAVGLAVMTELPVVIINAQRGGPSTGLPTKTEQADLLQVMFGRNGESPVAIVACKTPSDCFEAAIEAARLALLSMSPVFLMTDGYLMMGSEPWPLPHIENLPSLPNHKITDRDRPEDYEVYARDPKTLARKWATPGTAGFEHRIGGLEKDSHSGNVSYDPDNHQKMVETRAAKIALLSEQIPDQEIFGEAHGDLLVLGWGSTYGAIHQAVEKCRAEGLRVSHAHLRYINPFPKNLGQILNNFEKVLVPELNLGQLVVLLRNHFDKRFEQLNKIKGRPFLIREIVSAIKKSLTEKA